MSDVALEAGLARERVVVVDAVVVAGQADECLDVVVGNRPRFALEGGSFCALLKVPAHDPHSEGRSPKSSADFGLRTSACCDYVMACAPSPTASVAGCTACRPPR